MTFYLFFLIYLGAGVLICGALFYWAVSRGQFKDQERARYFPLAGDAPQPGDAATAKWPRSIQITVVLVLGALVAQIAVVLFLAIFG